MTIIDSQFEVIRVLQPFRNFEAVYQGQPGTRPIAFPGDLDQRAGKPGYSTNLGAGASMPAKGTRLKIWFPQVLNNAGEAIVPSYEYAFELKWRLRNYEEYLTTAQDQNPSRAVPYSIKGRPIGYQTGGNERIFLPGGADVLLYEQSEPGTNGDPGIVNVRLQRYRPMINTALLPRAPNGSVLVWQQGVYENGGTFAETSGVSYSVIDVETQGDELSIWVYKVTSANTWDFPGDDEPFSYTFGTNNGERAPNPFSGILITTGVAGT
jgi:hypothetical protein